MNNKLLSQALVLPALVVVAIAKSAGAVVPQAPDVQVAGVEQVGVEQAGIEQPGALLTQPSEVRSMGAAEVQPAASATMPSGQEGPAAAPAASQPAPLLSDQVFPQSGPPPVEPRQSLSDQADLPAIQANPAPARAPLTLAQIQLAQIQSAEPRAVPQPSASMAQVTPVNRLANPQPNLAMSQLTSVTQLSDVQPTDWAYQALQSLVERYGCIAGYPDGTFKGQRALTRFEFAAGMNACLDRISELIASSTADLATKEDLATLQRLQEEFAAELAALRGRVDVLDTRVSALEANQFSTTAKLSGETLFFVANLFGGDSDTVDYNNQVVGQYRVRLNFDSSFSGTDLLRVRLQAGNLTGGNFAFAQAGNEISYGAFANSGSGVVIDSLKYEFSLGRMARIGLYANGTGLDDIVFGNTINPLDNPARGAITRFGQRNAVYRTGSTTAGLATNLTLTPNISIQAGYLSGEPGDPSQGAGLFNGNYAALGQLTFRNLFNVVDLAFTYVNAYTGISTSATGVTAGVPFGLGSRLARVDADRPVIANSYGVGANFKILKGVQIGGWAGYSAVRAIGLGDASVWNYAGTLAFPDLFGRGNLGGIIFGMQPRLTGSDRSVGNVLGRRQDPDVGFHLETFYRWAVTDNIDITPGFVWITAPNHDAGNDDEFLGVVRTTFRF